MTTLPELISQRSLDEFRDTARELLNGDIEACRECDEPCVVLVPFDPDEDEGPDICRITAGAGEVMAIVPPYEGETLYPYARAIAEAGWVILELLDRLAAGAHRIAALEGIAETQSGIIEDIAETTFAVVAARVKAEGVEAAAGKETPT